MSDTNMKLDNYTKETGVRLIRKSQSKSLWRIFLFFFFNKKNEMKQKWREADMKNWVILERKAKCGNQYLMGLTGICATVQFSSVTQSCPTFCDPMDCRTPAFPVHHQFSELAQTRVHQVDVAIQPSLSSPFPPAFNLSQHQDLYNWVSSSHQVAEVLEFQLQHQSFQWIPRTDLL